MAVSQTQFVLLADLVRRRSGLALTPGKLGLVRSKLTPVAARFGFRKLDELLAELEDEPEEIARAVTEAMTTNETSFFRDPATFDYMRTALLPALTEARAGVKRLRIWCAAASTGQEAYSLAMLLHEMGLASSGWKIDLFATDISAEAVSRMGEGRYADHELERGLPEGYLSRYFVREDGNWRIADHLRRSLRIRQFNLLDHYGWLGRLDIILCRHVLLYFDQVDRADAVRRLERSLAPDGWLILGATERAPGGGNLFSPVGDARGVHLKARNLLGWQARLAG